MKLFITILLISLLSFSQIAEAKRFGGGRSFGHSRSYSSQSSSSTNKTTSGTRSKSGFGKLLAAGAIGAALGYLFSGAGGGIGWILLAIIAFFILSRILRNRAMSQQRDNTQSKNPFSGRTIQGQSNHQYAHGQNHSYDQSTAFADDSTRTTPTGSSQSFAVNGLLPDGTPETVFKHQGLNLFQQLQELNTVASLEKIKGYVTQDMFTQIKDEIAQNNEIATFENLETEVVGFDKIDTKWVGSIKFNGKVKEDNHSNWENFEEIWHFDRGRDEHIWQLSGIQQII